MGVCSSPAQLLDLRDSLVRGVCDGIYCWWWWVISEVWDDSQDPSGGGGAWSSS